MERSAVLREYPLMRFGDVYGRHEHGRLRCEEGAELPGVSVRTCHRHRRPWEAEGAEGLYDRRPGRVSARQAPVDEVMKVLTLFETQDFDFTLKQFHEKLVEEHRIKRSDTWVKSTVQAGGKVDKANPTRVGRAPAQLGIGMIPACWPEARGRSERMFWTLQGRLPQELRAAGLTDMDAANRFLRESYLPRHNKRFAAAAIASPISWTTSSRARNGSMTAPFLKAGPQGRARARTLRRVPPAAGRTVPAMRRGAGPHAGCVLARLTPKA
jgi:hypothetical protein